MSTLYYIIGPCCVSILHIVFCLCSHQALDLSLPPIVLCFPDGSEGKASACSVGDLGTIPEFGRSPGEGNGNPLQYSSLENHMEESGSLQFMVSQSRRRLSDFSSLFSYLIIMRLFSISVACFCFANKAICIVF